MINNDYCLFINQVSKTWVFQKLEMLSLISRTNLILLLVGVSKSVSFVIHTARPWFLVPEKKTCSSKPKRLLLLIIVYIVIQGHSILSA